MMRKMGDRQRRERRIRKQKELNKKKRRKTKIIPNNASSDMSGLILNKMPPNHQD